MTKFRPYGQRNEVTRGYFKSRQLYVTVKKTDKWSKDKDDYGYLLLKFTEKSKIRDFTTVTTEEVDIV